MMIINVISNFVELEPILPVSLPALNSLINQWTVILHKQQWKYNSTIKLMVHRERKGIWFGKIKLVWVTITHISQEDTEIDKIIFKRNRIW